MDNPLNPKTTFQKVTEHKGTTITGTLTTVMGIVVAVLPPDVKAGCLDAVQKADNPMLVGGLLAAGLGITILGPSLAKK